MYLESISIKGFRLFSSMDLTLNRGLNILVGENNSGKTALVDAIRLVLGTNSSERSYVSESDFFEGVSSLSIQLKFVNVDKHAHVFVEHLSHEETENLVGEKIRKPVLYVQLSADKTGREKRGYPYIRTNIKSGVDGNGLMMDQEVRDFLSTTYLRPLRDAESELSPGRQSRLSQILGSSSEIKAGTDGILKAISDANQSLLEDGEPLRKAALVIQDDYLHKLIFEADKNLLGAYVDIAGIKADDVTALTDSDKRKHLRAILEGLSLSLTKDRRVHGLGYHNLLFIATELLLLQQELDTELPLLLIEEPEAHLHPQLQMKLLQFINSKVKSYENENGIQCILSTHSPNISSKADPSEIILMSKGRGYPFKKEKTELAPDDYVFMYKFLDATKANIFFAKGILFVEGDAENILLPTIAKILGRPLEDYGVSIVKYGNSGSWKRFARIFLRKGKDDFQEEYVPTKIAVLRDLDLWPDCAEKSDANKYGFKSKKPRNAKYWAANCTDIEEHRNSLIDGLSRQNISVNIADDWTFEYCLAKHGLFDECFEAVKSTDDKALITGSEDERATYIQCNADKTDFAYEMAGILERDYAGGPDELRAKLPPYIVSAIEHVTKPFEGNQPEEIDATS